MSESFFKLSLDLKREFAGTRRLRMHMDYNENKYALVYEYFKHTLLSLPKENPSVPMAGNQGDPTIHRRGSEVTS